MPWFKVDDSFDQHPKADIAGNRALGLWVRAGAYSARLLTEGFIPTVQVAKLGGTRSDAAALVTAGLWEPVEGGYRFHQWAERQPTRAQVEADREAAAERQRRARERAKDPASHRESRRDADEQSRRDSHRESRSPHPIPTKPEVQNTPPISSRSAPQPSPTRGIRLPENFTTTTGMLDWARAKAPDVPAIEHEAFVDFWAAQPGAKALKVNWEAAWRTWMRRAQADIRSGRRPAAGPKRSTSDERVAQAQSLRAKYAELDVADGIATVTQLAIGGTA